MDKTEIKNWVMFLYKDLLNHYVKIGGYLFKFDQLEDFLNKKNLLERRITKANNQRRVAEQLCGQKASKEQINTLKTKNKQLKQEVDFVTTKIKAINKINEQVTLMVTYEELLHVYNQLAYCFDEVEFFQMYLLDELNTVKEEDLGCFYQYINDLLVDVKNQLQGKIIVTKIKVPLKNS